MKKIRKRTRKKNLSLSGYEGLDFLSIYKKPQVCGLGAAHAPRPYFFKGRTTSHPLVNVFKKICRRHVTYFAQVPTTFDLPKIGLVCFRSKEAHF